MFHHLSPPTVSLFSTISSDVFCKPPCLCLQSLLQSFPYVCLLCLTAFFLAFNTQVSEKPFLLPLLPHHCPTSRTDLSIPFSGSHGSLIIPPMLRIIAYWSMSLLTVSFLKRAWTVSYSFLYVLAHNHTWQIVSGEEILLNK